MELSTRLIWSYSLFFIAVVFFTIVINSILLRFSRTLGIRDKDQQHMIRWSPVHKPSLGGITFFIAFLISISAYSVLFRSGFDTFQHKSVLALVMVTSIAFTMGLADDAYNTRPWLKFFMQLACGLVLVLADIYIRITPYETLNYALTILWVAGLMNSINMLDNMDGITASVSGGIIVMLLTSVFYFNVPGYFDFMILLGVLGSLIGFLFHNWNPSRMFMGDTGSQFLGVLLAYFSIKYFWNARDAMGEIIQAKQFCLLVIGFCVPLVDTGVVVINRLARGQSPFVGGKDHTTHHLSYLGFSDRQVALIFIGLNLISLLLVVVMLRLIEGWAHWLTFAFLAYFLTVFSVMLYISRKNKKHESRHSVTHAPH